MGLATVVEPDIEADNGIIDGIDLLLLPSEVLQSLLARAGGWADPPSSQLEHDLPPVRIASGWTVLCSITRNTNFWSIRVLG